MNKKELIGKALQNETIKDNLSESQIEKIIQLHTRKNFDALTVKKNYRKLLNIIKEKAEQWKEARNQKQVKEMTVTIDWRRGSMGAMQAKATAEIMFKDGSYKYFESERTGGCGYDKESTAMSHVFNKFLIGQALRKKNNAPYGLSLRDGYFLPYYSYGVGISCYFRIVEYLGGKMETITSTNTITVYKIKF